MKLIMEGWRKFSKLVEAEESEFMKRRRAQLAGEEPKDKGSDTKVLKFGKKSEREPEGYQDPLADYFPAGSKYSVQGYVDPDADPDRDPLPGESEEDYMKHLVTTGEKMMPDPFAYVGPEDGGPTDEEAEESEKEAEKARKDRSKGLKKKGKKSKGDVAVLKPFRDPEDFFGNAVPALETDDDEMIAKMAANPIAKEGNTLYLRGLLSFKGKEKDIERWENELKTMIAGNKNLYKPENREALINIIKYGLTQDARGFIINRVRREVKERGIDDPKILKMIPAKQ